MLRVAPLLLLLLLAACATTKPNTDPWEGGKAYDDVVVPAAFRPHDTPPHKRQESGDKRIYGRYSYRTDSIYEAEALRAFALNELVGRGWTLVNDEVTGDNTRYLGRFEKGADKLDFKLEISEKLEESKRFSVLVVTLNDPYGN